MRKIIPFVIILLFSPKLGLAAKDTSTGNGLLSLCTNKADYGDCLSFVDGLTRGALLIQSHYANKSVPLENETSSPAFICGPDNSTLGQVTDVIIKFLQDHPSDRHLDAVPLSLRALREAWPCKK
jgi:hypothetical protein